MKNRKYKDPYAEGWDRAEMPGGRIDDNPYELGSERQQQWDEGFISRQKKRERSLRRLTVYSE